MKNRTSPIWKIPKQELEKIVSQSKSLSKILSYFNLINKGHNYRTLKKRLDEDAISYNHIKLGIHSNKGRFLVTQNKIPLSEILVEYSSYTNRYRLKIRLFAANLLQNQCYMCGQFPTWNDKPLSLQLDHINGISNDNRLSNLRILCPHCHSQTENFAGKNKHRQIRI